MSIKRVVPNISVEQIDESQQFYLEVFGFEVAMDMNWIVTLVSPSNPSAQLSLVKEVPAHENHHAVTITVEVADVHEIHAKVVSLGFNIVYPMTDEPWGVRRFHVMAPSGVIINVMSHSK